VGRAYEKPPHIRLTWNEFWSSDLQQAVQQAGALSEAKPWDLPIVQMMGGHEGH
jgi:hypothetical protein